MKSALLGVLLLLASNAEAATCVAATRRRTVNRGLGATYNEVLSGSGSTQKRKITTNGCPPHPAYAINPNDPAEQTNINGYTIPAKPMLHSSTTSLHGRHGWTRL